LPQPSPGLIAAHVEIVRVILAQRSDPRATASRALPAQAARPATSR
jgi:hypothetical protein